MYHSQKTERRFVLTFQMSQALRILQMSNEEIQQYVREEIEKNPLLEGDKPVDSFYNDIEIVDEPSAFDHLFTQIRETFSNPLERFIAEKITERLDERGFILSITDTEAPILSILQTLDPPGIYARNLQESFLLQLKAKGLQNTPIYSMIQNDYDNFLHHRFSILKKKYKDLDFSDAIQKISSLQLRPLNVLKKIVNHPISPDVYIRQTDKGWAIGLTDEVIPRFQVQYSDLKFESREEQKTIDQWKSSARWLINSLMKRKEILLKITERILHYQGNYLLGERNLFPLSTQDLAHDLGLNESTISRALFEKYIETPRGIFLMKFFLCSSPQKEVAKEILRELLAHEGSAFTDDQLAHALNEKGFKVARRTVSKYRRELKIPSAQSRRLL